MRVIVWFNVGIQCSEVHQLLPPCFDFLYNLHSILHHQIIGFYEKPLYGCIAGQNQGKPSWLYGQFEAERLVRLFWGELEETQVVAELVKAAVKENASTAQSQEAYLKKYEALVKRYEMAVAELERLQSLRPLRSQQDKKMALYIRTLKKQPEVMHEWNDTIWTVMVEKAIVHRDGSITFRFYSGAEIKVRA